MNICTLNAPDASSKSLNLNPMNELDNKYIKKAIKPAKIHPIMVRISNGIFKYDFSALFHPLVTLLAPELLATHQLQQSRLMQNHLFGSAA